VRDPQTRDCCKLCGARCAELPGSQVKGVSLAAFWLMFGVFTDLPSVG